MGDSRRFDLFAKLIARCFPKDRYRKVADVAGGKGYLQVALRTLGYNVTTFDKRKGRKNRPNRFQYQYRYFDKKIKDKFDLLVGMHPDEATDVVIAEAAKRKIPFVLCPCCIMPNAIVYWGVHKYWSWFEHLEKEAKKRGYDTQRAKLPMNGKSWCIIGRI